MAIPAGTETNRIRPDLGPADGETTRERLERLLRDGLIRNCQEGLTVDTSSPDGEAMVRGRLDLKLLADTILPALGDLIAGEREACARIADRHAAGYDPGAEPYDRGVEVGSRETARMIADLIRSRR